MVEILLLATIFISFFCAFCDSFLDKKSSPGEFGWERYAQTK